MRWWVLLLTALCAPCHSGHFSTASPLAKVDDMDWWKHAVFYQIYPRSFMDSNNDGIGDLQGIINRLDHLVELGVTAVWLSPIYPSPQADFGYDVSDFCGVDKTYGTMKDFESLVEKAHSLGLRVILDFVPNHSSDQHEWFQKALKGDAQYENYYIWSDGKDNGQHPPNNWISYFHGPAWTKPTGKDRYYLHQFHRGQPDLNYRNPAVQQEMKDVLTFWMDKGVDGFRVDTIPNLVEDARLPDEALSGNQGCTSWDRCYLYDHHQSNQNETFDVVYDWRQHLDDYAKRNGGDARIMMTEAYASLDHINRYYGSVDGARLGAHFSFNFRFITDVHREDPAGRIADVINEWVAVIDGTKYSHNWVLGNHDQHRLASRYGSERADGMLMLQMVLPGVAVTYMGEEIGMEDGRVSYAEGQDPQGCNAPPEKWDDNSRDFQRTPFQWDNSTHAGFNAGAPTWLPVSANYERCNVAAQRGRSRSPLEMYKALIRLRGGRSLLEGTLEAAAMNDGRVLKVVRRAGDDVLLLLMSVVAEEQSVDLAQLGLPDSMVVYTTSRNSGLSAGSRLSSTKLNLKGLEAVILIA